MIFCRWIKRMLRNAIKTRENVSEFCQRYFLNKLIRNSSECGFLTSNLCHFKREQFSVYQYDLYNMSHIIWLILYDMSHIKWLKTSQICHTRKILRWCVRLKFKRTHHFFLEFFLTNTQKLKKKVLGFSRIS